MNSILIFDDRVEVSNDVLTTINTKSYGEIHYKNSSIFDKLKNYINTLSNIKLHRITSNMFLKDLKEQYVNHQIIYLPSNILILDFEKFDIILKKILYLKKDIFIQLNKNENEYILGVCNNILIQIENMSFEANDKIIFDNNNIFLNIDNINNLLYFYTNSLDARYFNSLKGDKNTIIKTSSDIKKSEAEYNFYKLIPENFKYWFVQPFNFKKEDKISSYEMERLNVLNMAVQWIHNSFDENNFNTFLDKIYTYINTRPKNNVSKEIYMEHIHRNYFTKVENRLQKLQNEPNYIKINSLIQSCTKYNSIDDIFAKYKTYYDICYKHLSNRDSFSLSLTHGDPCFSNILYDKKSMLLKLIDPKGGLIESDLFTDEFYDIAKLSHSILGNYDFINNSLYEIKIDKNLIANFEIDTLSLEELKQLFVKKSVENGFEMFIIRTFEASLFLSMLPLHKDKIQNIFGFILIAISTLDELNENKEYFING